MDSIQSFFQVRYATYDDIPAIQEITHEAFVNYAEKSNVSCPDALAETVEDIKRDIDTKIVLIAIRDNIPVGSVRIAVDDESKTAYLSRFAVKISMQNNGIGKSVMNLVDEIMKQKNVKSIGLHTDSEFTSLIRFYYGRGFYIDSVDKSRGYVRAYMKKNY